MITKWKLFNFKSVKNETELEFGPLTIFAGPNSSGKSTWIQSILLISQTLSHRISSRSVVLNGALTRLGQFDDLKSFNGEADQIVFEWECHPETDRPASVLTATDVWQPRAVLFGRSIDRVKRVSCEVSFDANPSSSQRELYQLQPRLFGCRLSCVALGEDRSDLQSAITVSRSAQTDKLTPFGMSDLENDMARLSLDLDVALDDEALEEIRQDLASAEPTGCLLRHFLPSQITVRFNVVEEEARTIARVLCEDSLGVFRRRPARDIAIPGQVIKVLEAIVPEPIISQLLATREQPPSGATDTGASVSLVEWIDRVRRLEPRARMKLRQALQKSPELHQRIVAAAREGRTDAFDLRFHALPSLINDAASYLDELFSRSVKYLGPLRDEPKALYPLAPSADPSDVGLRGEYTAAVLDLHKTQRIAYIPTSSFGNGAVKDLRSLRSLEAAVSDWLQYLGVAEEVHTHDRGKLGHELKVTTSGVEMEHDLTHVGVGVSQVLPILVLCLLANRDTTLIFEQPELHLHPKVQTRLGDFFLSMALLGKQCIIETHSEYLVNRLRFRAASAPQEAPLAPKMKIYFVQKEGDCSTFRDVVLNDFGAIPDWPEGFFDQSQAEAEQILRAATRKRLRLQEKARDAEHND